MNGLMLQNRWVNQFIKTQDVVDYSNIKMGSVVILMLLFGKEKRITTHSQVVFTLTIGTLNLLRAVSTQDFHLIQRHFILMWFVFRLQKKKPKVETYIILKIALGDVTIQY